MPHPLMLARCISPRGRGLRMIVREGGTQIAN